MTRKGKKLTKKDIKEDEFAELMSEVVIYVKHHSRRIIGLVIVAVIVAVGVTFVIRQRSAAEIEAQAILARGNFDLKQGNYPAALRTYAGIRQRYRGTWSAADATFFTANAYFASGSYDSSMAMFDEYLNQGKRREDLTVSAKAGIAQSFEEKGMYEDAANNYLKALSLIQNSSGALPHHCMEVSNQNLDLPQWAPSTYADYITLPLR